MERKRKMKELRKLLDTLSIEDLQQLVALKQNGKQLTRLEKKRDTLIAQLAAVEEELRALGMVELDAAAPAPAKVKARRGRKAKVAKEDVAKADVVVGDVEAPAPKRRGRKPGKTAIKAVEAKAKPERKARRPRKDSTNGLTMADAIADVMGANASPEGMGMEEIIAALADRGFLSNATLSSLRKMILTAISSASGKYERVSRGKYRLA